MTFHFVFNQTPYTPSEYGWQEPWEVIEKVDFVEAWLTLTGCSYEGEPHDVELVITNVATIPNYAIIGMTYNATWNVGAESEVIIAGSYADYGLAVGDSVAYNDTFSPSLVGTGTVSVDISNIQWVETESITWQTETLVELPSKVGVSNFAVYGASINYVEPGTCNFTLQWTDGTSAYGFCDYKVTIVELGQVIAEEIGVKLVKPQLVDFSVPFDPLSTGGLLTMKLEIYNIHN